MTATAPYLGLGLRKRPPVAARMPAPDVGERFGRMRANAERMVAEPFTGITSDGNVVPGLYPLTSTGVSTRPIRQAALDLLETLTEDERKQVSFDLSSDAWRRWWNIHPFLLRHGLLLENLTQDKRDVALR